MWAYISTKSAANCAFYMNVEMQNTKRCIASATYILCTSNITRGSTRYVEPINRFENPIKEGAQLDRTHIDFVLSAWTRIGSNVWVKVPNR